MESGKNWTWEPDNWDLGLGNITGFTAGCIAVHGTFGMLLGINSDYYSVKNETICSPTREGKYLSLNLSAFARVCMEGGLQIHNAMLAHR